MAAVNLIDTVPGAVVYFMALSTKIRMACLSLSSSPLYSISCWISLFKVISCCFAKSNIKSYTSAHNALKSNTFLLNTSRLLSACAMVSKFEINFDMVSLSDAILFSQWIFSDNTSSSFIRSTSMFV